MFFFEKVQKRFRKFLGSNLKNFRFPPGGFSGTGPKIGSNIEPKTAVFLNTKTGSKNRLKNRANNSGGFEHKTWLLKEISPGGSGLLKGIPPGGSGGDAAAGEGTPI